MIESCAQRRQLMYTVKINPISSLRSKYISQYSCKTSSLFKCSKLLFLFVSLSTSYFFRSHFIFLVCIFLLIILFELLSIGIIFARDLFIFYRVLIIWIQNQALLFIAFGGLRQRLFLIQLFKIFVQQSVPLNLSVFIVNTWPSIGIFILVSHV